MWPSVADLAIRAAHLRAILFTELTLAGLAAAAVVALVGRRLGPAARERLAVGASLALVVWFAGPGATSALVAWALALVAVVEAGGASGAARAAVAVLLAVLVAAPVLAIGPLGDAGPHAREFVAFATNMLLLRAIGYARERRQGVLGFPGVTGALRALFFFPTFVNGPVETPRTALAAPIGIATAADVRTGLGRIARGAAKMTLVALALPPRWTQVLSGAPEAGALSLWTVAVGLWVWFYLAFSAWSDVAIGLARLCGVRVVENFDRPWRATDPSDFWRRWHVSLGAWLRDVVYVPLGGNRRHRAANVLAVFLVSGAWHVWGTLKLLGFGYYPPRAWLGFFVWAVLHAAAVSVAGRGRGVAAQAATFLFAAFAWMPFFMPADVTAAELARVLLRMLVPLVP